MVLYSAKDLRIDKFIPISYYKHIIFINLFKGFRPEVFCKIAKKGEEKTRKRVKRIIVPG